MGKPRGPDKQQRQPVTLQSHANINRKPKKYGAYYEVIDALETGGVTAIDVSALAPHQQNSLCTSISIHARYRGYRVSYHLLPSGHLEIQKFVDAEKESAELLALRINRSPHNAP